jgi:hypothetical protein
MRTSSKAAERATRTRSAASLVDIPEEGLDRVNGGGGADVILKGAALGSAYVAPFVTNDLLPKRYKDGDVQLAVGAVTWGPATAYIWHQFMRARPR